MVDDCASPSTGWREVYDEMGVDPRAAESASDCPDCGRQCDCVLGDVHECPDHGVFRASGDESERKSPDADHESDRHARGRAG